MTDFQKKAHDWLSTPHMDLASYEVIIVAFSGGKDSAACVLHLLDLGIPKHKNRAVASPRRRPRGVYPHGLAVHGSVLRSLRQGFRSPDLLLVEGGRLREGDAPERHAHGADLLRAPNPSRPRRCDRWRNSRRRVSPGNFERRDGLVHGREWSRGDTQGVPAGEPRLERSVVLGVPQESTSARRQSGTRAASRADACLW